MSTIRPRSFTRDFKLSVLKRMAETDSVLGLARELGLERAMLYRWRRVLAVGGEAGVRRKGRPSRLERAEAVLAAAEAQRPAAVSDQQRIAELERKIGEQQVALDFFRAALRHVRDRRRRSGGPGGTVSTP